MGIKSSNVSFFSALEDRANALGSLLCVGLDPRHALSGEMPATDAARQMLEENLRIIEATHDLALIYKPNIAFYEACGEAGAEVLKKTLEAIPEGTPVLLDAKRGDIGATAEAYSRAVFGEHGADAVTASPYMGKDSLEPFFRYPEKGVFVLCRTSNPGAADFQLEHDAEGHPLFIRVARTVLSWSENIGLVAGANDPAVLSVLRKSFPRAWFLAPGIGAQGGSVDQAVEAGINAWGTGILPAVSRSIATSDDPRRTAMELRDMINRARENALASTKAGSGKVPTSESSDSTGPDRKLFLKGLIHHGCFKTGEFRLKSGAMSPFYLDLRLIMSVPPLMKLAGAAYASLIEQFARKGVQFDAIAGIPSAGLPLAQAASLESGLPLVYPRMPKKAHGTGKTVEGIWEAGQRVLLLDDLISSGTSKIEAAEILQEAGLKADHLAVLIERGDAGRREMAQKDIELKAFARVEDLLEICRDMGIISEGEEESMKAYIRT